MSESFRAVGWNPQKRRYDMTLATGVAGYLGVFAALSFLLVPQATIETLLIRAFGTAAFVLLHVILSIGPLCRLNPRFLPLLYNRRHLGVTMFLLALVHGGLALFQFHALGNEHPLASVLTTSRDYDSAGGFPFQPFGVAALGVLFLMAATSHDFWLRTLTPPVWKSLHMLVYVAYAFLIVHVAFGLLQSDRDPRLAGVVTAGLVWILGLHLAAALKERRIDVTGRPVPTDAADPFVDACGVDDIVENRAKIICLAGERIAIFRYSGRVSAVSNACQHQNGPLGEGRILNGCIVCPWHGYEYLPHSGASPAPFTEKVPTFRVRVRGGRVLVDPQPFPPGTAQEPAIIDGESPSAPRMLAAGLGG
jgi:nitrite reductase/ring-hydroxylating ferredoxin subunit/DMSO/TMAO reductase YedYZ heme-binding membrane subunit